MPRRSARAARGIPFGILSSASFEFIALDFRLRPTACHIERFLRFVACDICSEVCVRAITSLRHHHVGKVQICLPSRLRILRHRALFDFLISESEQSCSRLSNIAFVHPCAVQPVEGRRNGKVTRVVSNSHNDWKINMS